jgi:4a-hydroxytetrahydrobiopterin dehydratase
MSQGTMTDKEITNAIAKFKDWKVIGGKLNRSFEFEDFIQAFAFITKVAIIAEKMDHHPELFSAYNRIVIDLISHDVGGIGTLDIELAKKINAL